MWDLIVSVPDHCLSFYFTIFVIILTYYFVTITASLMLLIGNSLFSVFFFYWYSYTLKIGINNKWSRLLFMIISEKYIIIFT